MDYYYYKKKYPNDILVYIEEYNKEDGEVIFDFVDSNEYGLFTEIEKLNFNLSNPSMVLLKNYKTRKVQENTTYAIKRDVIEKWQELNLIYTNIENSFLIGYIIELPQLDGEIFSVPISTTNPSFNFFPYSIRQGNYLIERNSHFKFPVKLKGKLNVTIRNVGQANWNEVNENQDTKIVFDAGAPTFASRKDVLKIIGICSTRYANTNPGLILSHWDKDHYHSLLGMSDMELCNFSFFICRNDFPNLTCRVLYGRIINAVGIANTYSIPAFQRPSRRSPVKFFPLNSLRNSLVLYNGQSHKSINISGIVLSVKTQKSSIILSGDCKYEQISRDILPHLNYSHEHNLVVPHHGGEAGKFIYNFSRQVKTNLAIISVGMSRKHPNANNVQNLVSTGFKVLRTNFVNKDITINL